MSFTISIAMATFNGGIFLKQQLDSFLNQKQLPDQLIVCDDGSSDDTMQILKQFAETAKFEVIIVQNEARLGVTKNFEQSVSLCTKDIIFLSDQDDVWFPEKIARVLKEFEENENSYLVANNQIITDRNLVPTELTKLGNIRALGLPDATLNTGCCMAFKSEFKMLVLPFDTDDAHDTWIGSFANLLKVKRIVEEPLQYYRRHGDNASNFIGSSTTTITYSTLIGRYGLSDARDGWSRQIQSLKAKEKRLLQHADLTLKMAPSFDFAGVVEKLRCKRNALERRVHNMGISRLPRIYFIVRCLLRGDYNFMSGWKSVVKDLVRKS